MKILRLITYIYLALGISNSYAFESKKEIEDLKTQIVKVAEQYNGDTDKREEAKDRLDSLIDNLTFLTPERTEAEKKKDIIGGWKNIWSYRPFRGNTNSNQVYQVVSSDGYYYNLSELKLGPLSFTSFLRGEYSDDGDKLIIKFTNNNLKYGFYKKGDNLVDIVSSFEASNIRSIKVPGPIGVTGILRNVYVDKDLRIVKGSSDGDDIDDLFILIRADRLIKN